MHCELLTVGNELLLGTIVDTNGAEMGRMLAAAGIRVQRRTSVGDDPAAVQQAVRAALDRSGTLIVSGGLGPTDDDLTRRAVADVFGKPLVRDAALVAQLEAWFARRGIASMPPANLVQADVPEGATVLPNPRGTAPGLWLDDGHGRIAILLPGVPKEMRGLMQDEVIPRLAEKMRGNGGSGDRKVIRSRTVRTTGIGESALADKLGKLDLPQGITLASLPGLAGTDLQVTAWDLPEAEAESALAKACDVLRQRVGRHAYGGEGDDLARIVLDLLAAQEATLAVAESCTGGLVGARLTAIPGSSRVFLGGVVAYHNDVKLGFLGVPADVIASHGAVSEAAAREMAAGIARALDARAAVSVTGIAGPDGGTDAKPVGTVWIAVHWKGEERAFHFVFPGDRDDVRQRAAQHALDCVRRVVGDGGA